MKILLILLALWPGTAFTTISCTEERIALRQCEQVKSSYETEFKAITDHYAERIGKLAAERVRKVQELKKKYDIKD